MNDKDKKKQDASYDLMQDTQYLLLGLDETRGESYAIEDILAEFGGDEYFAQQKKDADKAEPACEDNGRAPAQEQPAAQERNPKILAFPGAIVPPPEDNSDDTMVLIDMREYEEEPSARELFAASEHSAVREEPEEEEAPAAPKPLTMEDIVASTVDAVKAEQREEQKADPVRRRAEKQRRKIEKKKKQEEKMELPDWDDERSPREAAAFHKRRWQESRRGLILSAPVLILMWLPWLLEQAGIFVPYFSESIENAAVCVLVAQILLSILSASVFRAALEELRERFCTGYTYAAVTDLAALLDAVTLLALPGRSALAPLGGVAGAALVFSLWGLKSYHRGMWETMRAAAAGEPLCVADRCEAGIARGRRRSEGFVHRANLESTASQWQRLLLPALVAVSVVFALLSSVGRERPQDFLWCWSAVLCASCSFVCPMAYCV
ncbi:MAG: hypothetical protein IKM11_04395, partial [Oscillospiraceae bacterium]|nr:hypothetical protein [Oscillospiraceae bacterium]